MIFKRLKYIVCGFMNHPNSRVQSGPFNGYWTIYCPDCDIYWDEPEDEKV